MASLLFTHFTFTDTFTSVDDQPVSFFHWFSDEATTHYSAIIDQMTRGHGFLIREFGVAPRIGWHIGNMLFIRNNITVVARAF